MKRLLFIITAFCTYFLQAQDVIVLKDATEFQAKVLEINENNVRYKNWNNINGPTYTIGIDRISIINYSNGTKDVFNTTNNTIQNIIHDDNSTDTETKDFSTIHLINGTKMTGEIICITNTNCFVQTKNNTITSLPLNQIKTIKYTNGQVEDLQKYSSQKKPETNKKQITKELYLLNGNIDFMRKNYSLLVLFDFDNAPFKKDKLFKDYIGEDYFSIVSQVEQSFKNTFNDKSKGSKITEDVLSADYFVIINFVNIKETWKGGFWWSAKYLEAEGHIEIWDKNTNQMVSYMFFDYEGDRDYDTADRCVKLFNELAEKLSMCSK